MAFLEYQVTTEHLIQIRQRGKISNSYLGHRVQRTDDSITMKITNKCVGTTNAELICEHIKNESNNMSSHLLV